ncbi:hypothetical protein CLCOS_06570 [Clostridium coskatii]|uniref:Uncharacterized protein n=1 Tax=Clostridium coskatii TaxID=1705578 RepID=A0A162L4J1_9CLOT|nr:hypothetical protein WX73_01934 [Clostridium coskatii]OBR97063.1 hypothetical protein CLCOS_06570 [Clostridium coskatii]
MKILIIERTDKFTKFIKHPYAEFHPSLRIKRIQDIINIFEMIITMDVRETWQYIEDGILLRNIGKHDKTLGNL